MTVIMGDFNATGGSNSNLWNAIVRPYGHNDMNENGQQLFDFVLDTI
jgi:endonuclease/exonuclease/phosphatase family metal-dependent hydrolase